MSAPNGLNKLKAAMHGMAGASEPPLSVVPPAPHETQAPRASLARSRRGKRNISTYVNMMAAKQLRLLAVERDTSSQALVEEALNDLFRKYGKSAIV